MLSIINSKTEIVPKRKKNNNFPLFTNIRRSKKGKKNKIK